MTCIYFTVSFLMCGVSKKCPPWLIMEPPLVVFMDKHMKMTELGNSALDKAETHTSKTGE